MFRSPTWEVKTQKGFLEKVDMEMDIEGCIIEIRHVRGKGRSNSQEDIGVTTGKCGAFGRIISDPVWLEEENCREQV